MAQNLSYKNRYKAYVADSNSDKRSFLKCLQAKGSLKIYFIMEFLDMEANYVKFLAFRYTSLTLISLLDSYHLDIIHTTVDYLLHSEADKLIYYLGINEIESFQDILDVVVEVPNLWHIKLG
jgi:hypothetical protein